MVFYLLKENHLFQKVLLILDCHQEHSGQLKILVQQMVILQNPGMVIIMHGVK